MSRFTSKRPENSFCYRCDEIRLGEFDLGGVLYHGNYFHLYEFAREALLREIGLPYPEIYQSGAHLIVAATSQEFLRPLRYGDSIVEYLWIEDLRRTSLTVHYEIELEGPNSSVIHRATTTLVYVSKQNDDFRPTPLPDRLKQGFQRFEKTQ